MFEKRVEMNKIRYGGGKLVIMRAKVIAWSHVMLCKGDGGGGAGGEGSRGDSSTIKLKTF